MLTIIEPRAVKLSTRTEIEVRRNLPHARLRRVGAWVFLDHFGPTPMVEGMQVAAHPHTGLQTVTWPFAGRIEHCDSIGSRQVLQPGELNLMTAGHGVAHSERSLQGTSSLHAVQLWLALPSEVREITPDFEHHTTLPTIKFVDSNARLTLFIGEFGGQRSPARVYSPLVGAQLDLPAGAEVRLPLEPGWEHALLAIEGEVRVDGQELAVNSLAHVGVGADSVTVTAAESSTLIFIGGEPMREELFMWWNFIARSHQEVVTMREQWNAREARFGEVVDELGGWIPAPELPNVTLKPR
jgi:redox-sensitive bicupin YhaK (pirin superfamily)